MICALIPTYNNSKTILDIIERTAQYLPHIIVVNDGSTDDTAQLLQTVSHSITIVNHEKNKGKGAALRTGFQKARELGYTHALTIDSDGQHYPEDIPQLLRVAQQQHGCYVIGNRNIEAQNMPSKNTFANKFSNFWFTVQTGVRLPDTQTGMRVYPLNRLHGLHLLTSRYEAELELLVFAAWAGESIVSVPIRVYYPPAEERVSHFRPAYDFTRISILNTILCLFALIYGLPRRWWRSAVYGVWFLTCWLLFWIFTNIALLLRVSKRFYRRCFHYGASILMHTTPLNPFRVERSKESLPASQPAVYIANHTSLFDILSAVALHPNLSIVTQHWVFSNPFFAATARLAGFHSVAKGIDSILPQLQDEVAQGASILVFPEGTRSRNGALQRFHKGAFYIAEQLNLPIQPMFIYGTFRLMPKGVVFIGKTSMKIHLAPAILPHDTRFGATYQERTQQIQQYYQQTLTQVPIE